MKKIKLNELITLVLLIAFLSSCQKTSSPITLSTNNTLSSKSESSLENFNVMGVNLKKGLIAYYPFNGNANDSSGFNNNGIVTGAQLTTDRFNHLKSAYSFSTSGWIPGNLFNEIYVPYSSTLVTSKISICSWINPSQFYIGQETIIDKYDGGYSSPNGQTWGLMIYDNNANIYSFLLPPSLVNYQQPFDIIGPKIASNKWSFIAMTFDGSVLNVYINGILTSSKIAPTGFQLNTLGNSGMSIGVTRQANGFWQPYDGSIDDIRIYNRALSQSEITYLASH